VAIRWVEIAHHPDQVRYQALEKTLLLAGFESKVDFIEADELTFSEALQNAFPEFEQIRIGGVLCELAPRLVGHLPAEILTLQMADAFVRDPTIPGKWWPRCYLSEGYHRTFVANGKNLDLSGAIFVLGSGGYARAAVGALARLGFSRFSIADLDDDRGQTFVDELKRRYFGAAFEFVPRHQITQLPAMHVVAVNTLPLGQDEGIHGELFYFNFLKAGGIWLDMDLHNPNPDLEVEARSVGALIESAANVVAWTDVVWVAEAFAIKLDATTLYSSYLAAFQRLNR
jgi:hypothetical protein